MTDRSTSVAELRGKLDQLIRDCMLSPGSPEAIRTLVWFRYVVHAANVVFLVYVHVAWEWFADSYGLSMVVLNGASLASTVLLSALAHHRSSVLLPAAVCVALQDLGIVLIGILSSGLLASPIMYMPLLVLMAAAIFLGTRPAILLCACYVVAFAASTWAVVVGYWPWSEGPAWQAVGGLGVVDVGVYNVTIQVTYFLATYTTFLVVTDRLRATYCRFNERLEEARARIVQEATQRQAEAHLVEIGRLSSYLAHEIRNPLTVIMSGAEACQRNPHDADVVAEWAEDSLEQVHRLRRMLTAVLRYSRDYEPRPRSFDIGALVDEQLGPRGALAGDRVHWSSEGGLHVLADREHVGQMVQNLVRNAVQAAGSGGNVWVTAAPVRDGKAVALEVLDDGPGIPAEEREEVFRPFFSSKGDRGTGLGLAICSRLGEANDIEIVVDDSPHGGACLRLTIPAADAPPRETVRNGARAAETADESEIPGGGVVLIVDDEEPLRHSLARIVRGVGLEPRGAADLAQARAALRDGPPRLVLLDLVLGVEKGADLLDDIECTDPRPPVVVLSALADEELVSELTARGVRAYLVKPMASGELIATLRAVLD